MLMKRTRGSRYKLAYNRICLNIWKNLTSEGGWKLIVQRCGFSMLGDIQNSVGYNTGKPAVCDLSSEWFHSQLDCFNKVKLINHRACIYLKQNRTRLHLLVCIVTNVKSGNWNLKARLSACLIYSVFLAGNDIFVKGLFYIFLANLDFLGKNIRKIASNFPLKCYIEGSLSPWSSVFFSHLTTYFCLLVCWVLFQLFIKNGPMSLTKDSLYLPENTVQIFLTLTEKDQHTNTFS